MRINDIINTGKLILNKDIKSYKNFYNQHQESIRSSEDLDSSIEFELQYLKFLMSVENNYTEAIQQADKLKSLSNITVYSLSKVYRTLGVAYYHLGNMTAAMESYIESIKLLDKMSDKTNEQLYEQGLTYHNISLLYRTDLDQNYYDSKKRLEYLKAAESIFCKIKSNKGLSIIYNGISNYYNSLHKYGMALKYQFKSVELKLIEKDFTGLAINYGNLSTLYLKYNKIDKAEFYLLKSKEIKDKETNSYSKCLLFIQIGNLYKTKGDYKKAIENYDEAIEIASTHHLLFEHTLILTEKAFVYEKMHEYELAYQCLQLKVFLKEKIVAYNKSKALIELKYKHEYEKQIDEAKILHEKNLEIQGYITKLKNSNYELQQFAQITSHDLKEPVRLIRVHLDKLEKSLQAKDASQEYLINFIKNTSNNLYHLVNELQKYTNIEKQNNLVEEIILVEEFKDIINHVHKKFKNYNLDIQFENLPINIHGNRSQFNQLFYQLIKNAFIFNDSEEKQAKVVYSNNDRHHVFAVSDNGIGIDRAFYAKIFDIFERLHDHTKYPGTGIGLAIAKKIISDMNGYIIIESELGVGSTFKVHIMK